MKLITKTIKDKLLNNGKKQRSTIQAGEPEIDYKPVVCLFQVQTGVRWLLTELDPNNDDRAYGLYDDLDFGYPRLAYILISSLEDNCSPGILPVERNKVFRAKKTLSEYHKEGLKAGRISI